MTRTTSLLAALGLLVASIVGGALVSGAASGGGDKERTLPARQETIPIIGASRTIPAALDAAPTDVASALVGSGGAAASGLPTSEPITELSPASVETLRESAAESDRSGRHYGSIDFSSFLWRFFDPVCDEEHGARENPDGTCTTVLSLIDPPPFEILEVVIGPDAAAREECGGTFDVGPEERIAYPVLIISNNPADFTITSGPDGGTPARPRDATTDDEQRARWETWLADDLTPGTGGRDVHTCAVILANPEVDTPWQAHVEGRFGTADPPETDTADVSFTALAVARETRPRPPVSVAPLDDNHVSVRVPGFGPTGTLDPHVRMGIIAPAGVRADYPANPAEASELCAAQDPGALTELRSPAGIETIPGTDAADYPYDPAYSIYGTFHSDAMIAGGRYALCVVWLDGSAIVSRASFVLVAPSRYHWFATLAGLQFEDGPRPPSSVTLEVDSYDRILGLDDEPFCAQTPVSSDPVDAIWSPDIDLDRICRSDPSTTSSDIRWRSRFVLHLLVRHGDDVNDVWVTYAREPCADRARPECFAYGDLYRIPVPGLPGATASVSVSFSNWSGTTGATTWEIGAESPA